LAIEQVGEVCGFQPPCCGLLKHGVAIELEESVRGVLGEDWATLEVSNSRAMGNKFVSRLDKAKLVRREDTAVK
jgi:hypothetical protein